MLDRSVESLDAHVRDVRARLEQGLVPPNEVLSAEAQRSRQRVLALEARNTRAIAEADLRRLIGDEGGSPIVPQVPAGEIGAVPETVAALDRGSATAATRAAGVPGAHRRVAGTRGCGWRRRAAAGRCRRRLRLRTSESAHLSQGRRVGGLVGRVGERQLDAVGRRPASRRAGRGRGRHARHRGARWRLRSAARARGPAAVARSGLQPRSDRGRRRRRSRRGRSAPRAARAIFAAGVATSTEVLDAETAVLQAELDRTRAVSNARLARARLDTGGRPMSHSRRHRRSRADASIR